MHKLAEELVYLLAKKDQSWQHTSIARDRTVSMGRGHSLNNEQKGKGKRDQVEQAHSLNNEQKGKGKKDQVEQEESKDQKHVDKPTAYTPSPLANGCLQWDYGDC